MSDHQRTLIREAVVAQLTGRTSVGGRVKSTTVRRYNAKRGELPAIAVYTMTEDSDRDSASSAPRELARELTIEIAAAVVCDITADDPAKPLDALAKEIEDVIDTDIYVGGTVGDRGAILVSTVVAFPDVDADPLIGIITLTYSATYRTSPAAPTDLPDFRRAGVTTRIVGAGDDNAIHDEIELVQETP